jgi:hypothetical protein
MINVQPWAYFTVDGDPTQHNTPTRIQLSAGPHKIHFWNDVTGAQKDVIIDVPAHNDFKWVGKLSD